MQQEKKHRIREFLKDVAFDIAGNALFAAGVYSFAAKAEFAPGGISGLAIILNHFFDLPIGLCTLILNIPVVLLCLKTLGKRFLLRSLGTMVIGTLIMDLVFPLLPSYSGDPLMAALFAGVLSGTGLALIYWRGSSTGGTDFLIMSLRKKLPYLSIGTITILIDGSVILIGGLVFKRIDAVLQGIVMTALSTMMIDKITAGFTTGQIVFVITSDGERMAQTIMRETERGVTAIKGTGMFTGTDRNVLMCACSRAEACQIRGIASRLDKSAMVMLCPYDSVYGLGFQQSGE